MTQKQLLHELVGLLETAIDSYESSGRNGWVKVLLTTDWVMKAHELTVEYRKQLEQEVEPCK